MIIVIHYWGILLLCYFIASKCRNHPEKFRWLDAAINISLYSMVLVMGIKMGINEEVTSSLGTIGVQSLIVTAMTIAGSMAGVFLLRRAFKLDKHGDRITEDAVETVTSTGKSGDGESNNPASSYSPAAQKNSETAGYESEEALRLRAERDALDEEAQRLQAERDASEKKKNLITTVVIAAVVLVSMLAGCFLVRPAIHNMELFTYITDEILIAGISVMLGCIGLTMGLTGEIVEKFKEIRPSIILFPIIAVLGSMVAGVLFALISPVTVKEGLAISVGFGWYTYAPGVITAAGHDVAGAISFLHNVIRETVGIIAIPFAAQKFGYLESTAIPGVAAMDICLPIIGRSCQSSTLVYGFLTGLLMSGACSVLVPLIMNM